MDKLNESVAKFPNTDIWMDSCGEEELEYGLAHSSIVGATSNPIIIGNVIAHELDTWEPRIREMVQEMPNASEEDIAWKLIYEISALRSKKLLPTFKKFNGKKGRLSTQVNARNYRCVEKMVAQALEISGLAENMQVKIPASVAGIQAMEEVTAQGVSINATVCYTVSQAIAVAEAVERGLARRRAAGLDVSQMAPVCTLMVGRADDWIRAWIAQNHLPYTLECTQWVGIAITKHAYKIFKERGYTTRLLTAAYRSSTQWGELVGGDLCMTINYDWHKRLNSPECDVEVVSRIDNPIPDLYMKELDKMSEFHKAYDVDGQKPEEFEKFGAFQDTLFTFIGGYEELLKLIRKIMIFG